MKISHFTKINLYIAIVFIVLAFAYPFFMEKFVYSNISKEAISVAKIIEKTQNINYVNYNKYISVKKGDVAKLVKNFSLSTNDIKYYDYSIFTTYNSYTLYAEPKIGYLKNREISPKIYVYYKKLNEEPIIKWN